MNKSHRLLKGALFASALGSILFAISCVELGPVPQFEYSYDFDTDLPVPDTASLAAENVEVTPGSVDNSGAVAFATNLSSPTEAANYAEATGSAVSATQQTYWAGQTPNTIGAAIENGAPAATEAINDSRNSLQSNSALLVLVPGTESATGALSNDGGRMGSIGSESTNSRVGNTKETQQDELDECKQAAQDAYLVAKERLDSILTVRVAAVDLRYESQLNILEAKRAPLEEDALVRHNERKEDYLDLYNSISASVVGLFSNGDITAAQRDQLNVLNLIIYALSYQASYSLYTSEMSLINGLMVQAETNLQVRYNTMINGVNSSYNTELRRLQNQRDAAQRSCHDQGGIHDQGGAGPN